MTSRQRGFAIPAIFASLDFARIGLWALVGAAIGFSIWFHGYAKGSAKLDAYKAAQATEAARIIVKRGEVTERVVTKYVQVAGKTQIVTNTVEKEVIRYEAAKLDTCPLSVAAVSLHNSAAANAVPDATRSTDGTASGLETSALTKTCAANYAEYHKVADRLRGLQEWAKAQSSVK